MAFVLQTILFSISKNSNYCYHFLIFDLKFDLLYNGSMLTVWFSGNFPGKFDEGSLFFVTYPSLQSSQLKNHYDTMEFNDKNVKLS